MRHQVTFEGEFETTLALNWLTAQLLMVSDIHLNQPKKDKFSNHVLVKVMYVISMMNRRKRILASDMLVKMKLFTSM